jgi:hypothetical protein
MITTAVFLVTTLIERRENDVVGPTYAVFWVIMLALFMWFDYQMVKAL